MQDERTFRGLVFESLTSILAPKDVFRFLTFVQDVRSGQQNGVPVFVFSGETGEGKKTMCQIATNLFRTDRDCSHRFQTFSKTLPFPPVRPIFQDEQEKMYMNLSHVSRDRNRNYLINYILTTNDEYGDQRNLDMDSLVKPELRENLDIRFFRCRLRELRTRSPSLYYLEVMDLANKHAITTFQFATWKARVRWNKIRDLVRCIAILPYWTHITYVPGSKRFHAIMSEMKSRKRSYDQLS